MQTLLEQSLLQQSALGVQESPSRLQTEADSGVACNTRSATAVASENERIICNPAARYRSMAGL